MKSLVFINSHPIQYFAPLYRQLSESNTYALKVLYLSDETVNGYIDEQFGTHVQWDIPLLEGYDYKFIPNNSWKPSFYNGFWGLINWGLISELRRMPPSIVISHGWEYASNIIALWAAKAFGHTVCLRGETPLMHEMAKKGLKKWLRFWYLKCLVFSVVDKFLYIGQQNKLFYKAFGISEEHLAFVPYAVDNERLQDQYKALLPEREKLRQQLGLTGKRLILYSGKLTPKKRPLDLLQAYAQLRADEPALALIFMGDGNLRTEIEAYCLKHNVPDVLITGFVNQSQIAQYYTVADLFVMCSGVGETWGLSVNEAMNFELPLIISDQVGCFDDLLIKDSNGFSFHQGDVSSLHLALFRFLHCSVDKQQKMGYCSSEHVSRYSYQAIMSNIKDTFSPKEYENMYRWQ